MSDENIVKEEINNELQSEETPDNTGEFQEDQAVDQDGELSSPEKELEIMTAKCQEEKDKYLRLYSDFENFRKQKIRERIELLQTASGEVVKQLLPVIDDFERAAESNESIEDVTVLREGFKLILHKMKGVLEKQGLKEIDAVNQDFDTDLHEALTNVPAPTEELKGKVVDVAEKGYYLNDKVIRFAKVIVGQ